MIVALTGAGISAPSGIPTFQERPDLRDMLAWEEWATNAGQFWRVIADMYHMCDQAEPNEAHVALAQAGIPVITQNIDNLHQRAGSRQVIELHGNITRSFCLSCGRNLPTERALMQGCKCEQCRSWLKPDVVLYGEPVKFYERALETMAIADTLLVIGTSLEVYPAASIPEIARDNGIEVVIINKDAEVEVPRFLRDAG